MKPTSLWCRAGLRLAVVMAVAGCAGSPSQSAGGEPPIDQWLTITDTSAYALPLESYRLGSHNLRTAGKAEDILLARCVRRFGFDIPPAPERKPPASGIGERYGITDEQRVQTRGYHGPVSPPNTAGQAAAPAGAGSGGYPPDVEAIVTGRGQSSYNGQPVPEGGCVGEARRKLAQGAPTPAGLDRGERLSLETYEVSQRDSRVVKVFADWSACMQRSGHSYATPRNANNDPAFGSKEPTAREITVAVADVRCKKETNLVSVWATVETAYQKRAIEQNAEELAVLKRNFEIQEKNAADVVTGK
jgi:hypothetical protein